jgi:hypothetical protein
MKVLCVTMILTFTCLADDSKPIVPKKVELQKPLNRLEIAVRAGTNVNRVLPVAAKVGHKPNDYGSPGNGVGNPHEGNPPFAVGNPHEGNPPFGKGPDRDKDKNKGKKP